MSSFREFLRQVIIWSQNLVKQFTGREKLVLGGLIIVVAVSSVLLSRNQILNATYQPVSGGVYLEGLVGFPRFIHPLFSDTNDVDKVLSSLIYSGLTKISAGREVVPDLATQWKMFDEGRTYVFHLRNDVLWHDGVKFDADDVLFTVNILQTLEYDGILKASFADIAVEKIDEYTVKFTLPTPSAFFLYNLSVGIVPRHIYHDIPVVEMRSKYVQTDIIGTGPYSYKKSSDGKSVTLHRFDGYYGKQPMIDTLVFFFFENEKNLFNAFKNREVSAAGFRELVFENSELTPNDAEYIYSLPQYKAIYFNQASGNPVIQNRAVRQALAYATNKQQIIDEVENGRAEVVDSPILPGFWGHKPDIKKYNFDIATAAKILKDDNWKDIDQDGFLEKDGVRLGFKIAVRDDESSLQIAEILRNNWASIGAEVTIEALSAATLIKEVIRPRAYEVLIFGQDLGIDSDPYVYWHSSQAHDPGLALAVIFDKDIDNNLESARIATSLNKTIVYYHRFQDAFADLVPAILLYQPRYTYLVDSKVRGVTDKINLSSVSDRFININEWYIKTKKE
ncbi:hypothetical protein DRH29_01460 [candidate division Kazan bacterium]|uniref:Solute-binding protein family 5 domain-containing protein n=1 Tax=candidate division Kazan bacterium TaxID=2202143 RepID=A0A420ZD01_UNCK3|nr:MAG: hypothetical protein DRH29_01460 [candidate division Kazan bacterium]